MRRVGAKQIGGVFACALLLVGCSGADSACVPGDAKACACSDGESGAQSCNSDGTGYEPCLCEGGSTSSGADATGSSHNARPDATETGSDGSTSSAPSGYVLIPAGTFMMGSPESEPCRYPDEGPQHEVTLTGSFWLKTTEVTQGEWEALMGNNPSQSSCDTCPVEKVNWWETLAYANALSAAEGLSECYTLTGCNASEPGTGMTCHDVTVSAPDGDVYACEGYRLPTEAEWEYAARAATTTQTYNGDIAYCDGYSYVLEPIAWFLKNSGSGIHAVAQKDANPWGLYDMLGNVWEWTWDRQAKYYSGASEDPTGPFESDTRRVIRGCGWDSAAGFCRVAYRNDLDALLSGVDLGFRPARSLP